MRGRRYIVGVQADVSSDEGAAAAFNPSFKLDLRKLDLRKELAGS